MYPFSVAQSKKIRFLVTSGGHEQEPSYEIFNSIPFITYDTLVQPPANELITLPEIYRYDVLVFYDIFDSISPETVGGRIINNSEGDMRIKIIPIIRFNGGPEKYIYYYSADCIIWQFARWRYGGR